MWQQGAVPDAALAPDPCPGDSCQACAQLRQEVEQQLRLEQVGQHAVVDAVKGGQVLGDGVGVEEWDAVLGAQRVHRVVIHIHL